MSRRLAVNIFVLGLSPKCGKTLIASALVKGLLDRSIRTGFIKPLSLVDTYIDLVAINRSADLGYPVSTEAVQLSEINPNLDYDLVNPVVLVSAPPRLDVFLERRTPSTYFAYVNNPFKRVVLVKTVFPRSIGARIGYLYEWLLARKLVYADEGILQEITRNIHRVLKINIHVDVESFLRNVMARAIMEVYEKLTKKQRVIIIEGFSEKAWPLPFPLKPDIVLVVAEGSVLMFNGDRYATAVAVKGSYSDMSTLRTRDLISLLNPNRIFHTPPLSPLELVESRVEKLSELISAVVDFIEA
ncbi:MAG TPA: hypothetical protein ENJ59_02740 [Thermofilum sp.]|nr:hypothetical protein [Thermofilum sp.]